MVAGAVIGLKSAIRDMCLGNEFVVCCVPIRIEENDRTSNGKANEAVVVQLRITVDNKQVAINELEAGNSYIESMENGVNWMLNAGRSIHGTCTVKPLGGAKERAPAVFCRKALTQSATFIHECDVAAHAHAQVILQAHSKPQAKATAHVQAQMVVMTLVEATKKKLKKPNEPVAEFVYRGNASRRYAKLETWQTIVARWRIEKRCRYNDLKYQTTSDIIEKQSLMKQLDSLKDSFDENSKARLSSLNLFNGGHVDKQGRKCSGGIKRSLRVAVSLIIDPKTFGNADADGDGKIYIEE
ncbi:hypothetical protein Tco_0020036 [Tanacetum coccineum]